MRDKTKTNEPAATEWAEVIANLVEAIEERRAAGRDVEDDDRSIDVPPVMLVIDEDDAIADAQGTSSPASDDVLALLMTSRLLEYSSIPLAATSDGRAVDSGVYSESGVEHEHIFGAASGGKSLAPGTYGSGELR